MNVNNLGKYLKKHWPHIREQLLVGTYSPKPVKRVEIPKPDGGTRKVGVPTALDRFVQRAMMQVLQRYWDKTFSENSYGFRPGRSAHQAVNHIQQYVEQGYHWVVDIDLEKFFDQVNHDKLMGKLARRMSDKRLLKTIRAFLNAGVMENGLVSATTEGTPQGGLIDETANSLTSRTAVVRTRTPCGVTGKARESLPMLILVQEKPRTRRIRRWPLIVGFQPNQVFAFYCRVKKGEGIFGLQAWDEKKGF